MSVAFAAHSSREIQAAAAPTRAKGGGGDDEEGEEEELIDDPMAQPEFAAGGGDLAHHQAGVTDRVRSHFCCVCTLVTSRVAHQTRQGQQPAARMVYRH